MGRGCATEGWLRSRLARCWPGLAHPTKTTHTPAIATLGRRGQPRVLSSGGMGRQWFLSSLCSTLPPPPPLLQWLLDPVITLYPRRPNTRSPITRGAPCFWGTCQMYHLPKTTYCFCFASTEELSGKAPLPVSPGPPRTWLARSPSLIGLQEWPAEKSPAQCQAWCVRAHLWASPGLSLPICTWDHDLSFLFWGL